MATESDSPAALQKSLLDRLERHIDLPAWLIARGFKIAPAQPDPTRLAMIGPATEVLHLRKDIDRGGWTYVNDANPTDRGGAVDFMLRKDGATLAACVNRLAGCVIRAQLSAEGRAYQEALRDRDDILHRSEVRHAQAVRAEQGAMRSLERLGVDGARLDERRFGRIQSDDHVAALFRNPTALERSGYRSTDSALVFIERPIDAIAFEGTHGNGHACYVYTGDDPDRATRQTIARVLADLPKQMNVVLAFGRGRRSDELAAYIAVLAPTRSVHRQKPDLGSRWSDHMQIEHRHRKSIQRQRDFER